LTQAVILHLLDESGDDVSGLDLRRMLEKRGIPKVGPDFYQIMGRLERNGYITSTSANIAISEKRYRQKLYKITHAGQSVLSEFTSVLREFNRNAEMHGASAPR
jgi:DNA-binding PadR family transcriptional regulator